MDVQAISESNEIRNTQAVGNSGIVNSEDFYRLLVAQIQNQDPTEPMDASQTVTQMAQISASQASLEVKSIADQISAQSQIGLANNMIGKYVKYLSEDSENEQVAWVDAVLMRDNGLKVVVNGKEVSPGNITAISDKQEQFKAPEETNWNIDLEDFNCD